MSEHCISRYLNEFDYNQHPKVHYFFSQKRGKFVLINRACELKGQFHVDVNGMWTARWYKLGFFILLDYITHCTLILENQKKIHKSEKMLAGCDKILLYVVFIKQYCNHFKMFKSELNTHYLIFWTKIYHLPAAQVIL